MKKTLLLFSLFLFSLFCTSNLKAQDLIFTQVTNPAGMYYDFYLGQHDGLAYIGYRDNNYDRYLYTFDGDELIELDTPEGVTFNWSLAQLDDLFYMTFYDAAFNNIIMSYQNGAFTQIQADFPDEGLGYYAFTYEDQVYITYYNFFNFLYTLKVINGDVVEDVPLPEGFFYGNSIGAIDGQMFLSLNDEFWNSYFYSFDGSTFEEVTLPEGTSSPYAVHATEDLIYLSLYDQNFNSAIYTFDGTTFELLPLPEWAMGVSFIGELDGNLYFRLDDENYQGILHQLNGSNWVEITNPDDHYLGYSAGYSESALYPAYANTFNFNYSLAVYDGTDLNLVESPTGYNYNTFFADNMDGAFLSYYNQGWYSFLFYYDGTELIEVPVPEDENEFNYYEFSMDISGDEILFFSFRDFNYNPTLYWFGEPNAAPTADDNFVYTLIETPYSFETTDFNFSDIDLDDTLAAIQIVEKPSIGILHLNGANIATGQVIEAQYLEELTYVPMNEGQGEPYDSFTFRVFDGNDFSEAVYTMFINVVETIVSDEDLELVAALNIYPNPASDFLQIDIGDYHSPEKVQVYLYNNNGVAVIDQPLKHSMTQMDISVLPRGGYTLVFRTESSVFGKQIILQ
jgi:hypothetical protein